MLLCLSYSDSFLWQLSVAVFLSGHSCINERKSTDSAQIHQRDQYQLRGDMQMWCNPQTQSHRAYRRRCFIQAGGQWKIFIYTDKNASTKEQSKVHRYNGCGSFDSLAIYSASKELNTVPLAEGGNSIAKQNS